MKKIISLFLMIFVTLALLTGYVYAAEIIASGTCGETADNVKWELTTDGTLTIKGNGKMSDFSNPFSLPYAQIEESVVSIVIDEGITHIGRYAFFWKIASDEDKNHVETITIPKSLKSISDCTFAYINNAKTVYYNAENCVYAGSKPSYGDDYFAKGKKLIIGKNVKNIGAYVFYRAAFSTVQYEGTEEEWNKVNVDYTGNEVLKNIKFSAGETPIRILMNNEFIECDQPPVIQNGRTLVPMRAIFEALGATVSWDANTNTASGVKDGKKISFTLGEKYIDINGSKKEIDVAAQTINNRTLIPVRAVAEAFDCKVNWNGQKRYVIVSPTNQQAYRVEALNSDNEVLATVHFNSDGQITTIYGKSCKYLAPFFVNIFGNTYVDHLGKYLYGNDAVLNFDYDENGNLIFVEAICEENGNSNNYSYTYTNGVYTQVDSDYEVTDYDYIDSECFIGEPPYGNIEDSYVFNNYGLLKEYKYFSAGYWKRTFEYDSKGKLLSETHNTMGPAITKYFYNENSKLIKSIFYPEKNNLGTHFEVTYKYITE